jgi:CubicO group peptidase (beta-lactamase class C family)
MPDWLDALATEEFNEHTLAGLAVGVVRGGELERFAGRGLADVESERPVEPDTVFRIGSISKTMTAILAMQLVEEGRIALGDPVNRHLRGFRVGPGDEVTVRHLLTHTAGVGELRGWSDVVKPMIALGTREPATDLSSYYAPALRTGIEPGRKWAYANHGFAALGQLVADVRGRPFADVARERIFEPLGMDGSDFVRSERVRDRLAVGYAFRRGRFKAVKDWEVAVAPAGSCYSSTADMARFVAALAAGGAPLLQRETLELMLTPDRETDPRLPAMGLGFFLTRLGEHRIAMHDGGWSGFISSMLVAPDDGAGVVAFTNTSAGPVPQLLGERVLRRMLEVEEEAAPVPDRPHAWHELTGVYRLEPGFATNLRWWPLLPGGEAHVEVRKGHLVVQAASPLKQLRKGIRLYPLGGDAYEARHDDYRVPLAFERDGTGAVTGLRAGSTLGGFLHLRRRPRIASTRLWARAGAAAAAAGGAAAILRRHER